MNLKNEITGELDKKSELSEKLYKLKEEEHKLELEISDEQFMYSSLMNSRNIFHFSTLKEIMILLYFVVFFVLFKGVLSLNIKMWLIAKENATINKLIEMMESMSNIVGTIVLIIIAIAGFMLVYKIFLIWLNSDLNSAHLFVQKYGKETYSSKLQNSSIKLSRYYLKKNQIAEEIMELEKRQKEARNVSD